MNTVSLCFIHAIRALFQNIAQDSVESRTFSKYRAGSNGIAHFYKMSRKTPRISRTFTVPYVDQIEIIFIKQSQCEHSYLATRLHMI